MLLDDLFQQRQCLRAIKTLIALARLALQRIESVHIQPRQRPGQHPKEIRAHLAEKLCGERIHPAKNTKQGMTTAVIPKLLLSSVCSERMMAFQKPNDNPAFGN